MTLRGYVCVYVYVVELILLGRGYTQLYFRRSQHDIL